MTATTLLMTAPVMTPANSDARAGTNIDRTTAHVLDGQVARVIVRVHGSSACSGTPLAGTAFVVTAAHCVLDTAGTLVATRVVRNGVNHLPLHVLIDPSFAAS